MQRRLPRDFWLYLFSRFCGATALTMLSATVAWHVFDISHSAFNLGLIGLVQFIPAVTLSLIGGVVADTYERRRIVMIAEMVPLLGGIVLMLATHNGWVTLPALYALVFCVAAAAAFDNPARSALLPGLVGLEAFPRAVTIASTSQALAFASGPATAGVVIASAGIPAAYLTTSSLLLLSIVGISRIVPSRAGGASRVINLRVIREGVRYVWNHEILLGCMAVDMFAVIFGGATALLPIYAREILQVGERGYGILSASLETGALLTSLILISRRPLRHAGRALLMAVTAYGVATILFGLSRYFPLSVAAYMAAGMADQISVVMRHTIIQLNTPDELRGRVSSVNFIFIGTSNQLGAVESGFVAALTSPTFAVVSGGIGCLLVVATVAARMPRLRRYTINHAA